MRTGTGIAQTPGVFGSGGFPFSSQRADWERTIDFPPPASGLTKEGPVCAGALWERTSSICPRGWAVVGFLGVGLGFIRGPGRGGQLWAFSRPLGRLPARQGGSVAVPSTRLDPAVARPRHCLDLDRVGTPRKFPSRRGAGLILATLS
jgi:hypothetical protein